MALLCPKYSKMSLNYSSVEDMYQHYLMLVGLKYSEMHEVQRTETRRAFFAGVGQTLLFENETLTTLTELNAVIILQKFTGEVNEFWQNESSTDAKNLENTVNELNEKIEHVKLLKEKLDVFNTEFGLKMAKKKLQRGIDESNPDGWQLIADLFELLEDIWALKH